MRWQAFVNRSASLPLLHRAMPVALATGLFAGSWAYFVFAPPTYETTAVVDFGNASTLPEKTALDATVLAESILRPEVQDNRMEWSDRSDKAQRTWRDSPQVVLSRISSSKLRIILRGREPVSTEAASRILVSQLTRWSPPGGFVGDGRSTKLQDTGRRAESGPRKQEQTEVETGSRAEREVAMLGLTLRLLDAKIGAEGLSNKRVADRGDDSGSKRRLEMQRRIVSARLVQELAEAKATTLRHHGKRAARGNRGNQAQPAAEIRTPVELATNNRDVSRAVATDAAVTAPEESFHLVSQDSGETRAAKVTARNLSIGGLASLFAGSLYLAVALWWFRPVGDMQELLKLVPRQVRVFSDAGKDSQ